MIFTQENAVVAGVVLLGSYSFPAATGLANSVIQVIPPLAGTLVLDLFVGGVAQGLNVTLTAASPVVQTVPTVVVAPANAVVQWRVVSFDSTAPNAARRLSIVTSEQAAPPVVLPSATRPLSFSLKAGDLAPGISAVLTDANGVVVDLTGASVVFTMQSADGSVYFTKAAVVNAPATGGSVTYNWSGTDSAVAGAYQAQFVVTLASGKAVSYPSDSYIPVNIIEALPVTPPVSVSAIDGFLDTIRALLGDFAQPPSYTDDTIKRVVRAMVLTGRLPGYRLDPTRTQVVPSLQGPLTFGLLCYRCVEAILMPVAHARFQRTRAFSMRIDAKTDFLWQLQTILFDLENPVQFASWQSFGDWALAITGINIWQFMTEMQTQAPVATVTLSVSGLTVSGPGVAPSG